MGGISQAKNHPYEYIVASALSAFINYPLWRASAIGQSGFRVQSINRYQLTATYMNAFSPPYKGCIATICGMTWARAAIFWGSDRGKEILKSVYPDIHPSIHTLFPPLMISTVVQCVNQPVVRASVTLQNPDSNIPNVRAAVRSIYESYGMKGLWHGTNAGILKTVPKYCTAILVKDYMEEILTPIDPSSPSCHNDKLLRSAYKSAAAGLAGAVLTNPLDVIRNEMFKTNKSLVSTVHALLEELGWKFVYRGMSKNLVAVSVPVASTIFFTDVFIQFSTNQNSL